MSEMKKVTWLGGPQDGLEINVHKDCTYIVISRLMLGEKPDNFIDTEPNKEIPPVEVGKIICPIEGRYVKYPYDKV